MRRFLITTSLILAGITGASASQFPPGYSPAGYGHDAASQRLALQYAANNAMAAEARAMLRQSRNAPGRPQRQMR